jgi:tartrate dehydratase beta subunit/fumarate hydratase class I family protein
MLEWMLPISGQEWATAKAKERVLLSGRIFLGGNKALNRLAYWIQEEKLLNLELSGCVWMYALPKGWTTAPLRFEPQWITDPLPADFMQLFGDLGLTLAGVTSMERGLTPAEPGWFSSDRILRVRSLWWMDQGLSSALWALEARRLGPFMIS